MMLHTDGTATTIEKALASPGRLKILRLLMRHPNHAFTRYEIGKKTPLNPTDIRNSLNILVELGWVKGLTLQHLQKYSVNLENELVFQIYDLFKRIKYV